MKHLFAALLLLICSFAHAEQGDGDSFCKASVNPYAVPVDTPLWWVVDGQHFLYTKDGETLAFPGAEMTFCLDESCTQRHRFTVRISLNLSQAAKKLAGMTGEEQMKRLAEMAGNL
ncbi:MAG: hypothetical protein KGZ83_18330 [Sulfuricella sp.]|nr:hypothetical protein [Sulfuricella sp.]